MKIGIFGGSFNPPHNMHKNIAKELIAKGYLDKVIFVPTGMKYEYKNNLLNDKIRVKMLSLMIKDEKNMKISKYELKNKTVYTYETLNYFKKKYKNDEIYFICGTDNLTYMDTWAKGIDILENYKILVIKRDTDDINEIIKRLKKYQKNIITTDIIPNNISSTKIRNMIKDENKHINNYLDLSVLNYIKRKKIYTL